MLVELMAKSGVDYDVVWVHDWHFSSIAGELLQPDKEALAASIYYVQHLHNALYQGIYNTRALVDIVESDPTDRPKRINRSAGTLMAARISSTSASMPASAGEPVDRP